MKTFELKNEKGFRVGLLDYGASISSIAVPAGGHKLDVVLGYPNLSDYLCDEFYLGATLGRYAGRIALGQFSLNSRRYQLSTGDGVHCLHGGPDGFSRHYWAADPGSDSRSVTFQYESVDGEQGFPGQLAASARYSLHGDFGLLIEYRASADAATVVNLSNHAYFNLNGYPSEITNHSVLINADRHARLDAADIPDGELLETRGGRYDFIRLAPLAVRMVNGGYGSGYGYDNTFALNGVEGTPAFAAAAFSPDSGLWLKVHTTQPALHFYTGEYLQAPMLRRGGLCFEAQNFPDAPNKAGFPSAVLLPGQVYQHSILYEFGSGEL